MIVSEPLPRPLL